MKRVMWMVLAGLFLVAGSVQANCGKCGAGEVSAADMEQMVNEKTAQMTKDLKLSEAQQGQIRGILKEKMEKARQLKEQHQAAMDSLQAEVKAKLKGVLSEEQMKGWEAMKDKCPMCKDGKPCPTCKLKKGRKDSSKEKGHHGHGHM